MKIIWAFWQLLIFFALLWMPSLASFFDYYTASSSSGMDMVIQKVISLANNHSICI